MLMTRLPLLPALFLIQAVEEDALRPLLDFAGPDFARTWQVVNDGVMGGVSDGRFRITADGTLAFSGRLSLENIGGFALIRTTPAERVQGMGPVEPDQINGLGFMLSDKKPGPFKLEVRWVKIAGGD